MHVHVRVGVAAREKTLYMCERVQVRVHVHVRARACAGVGGRPLLREERRTLPNVCEVGGVACLVHQRCESGMPRPNCRRVSK